MRRLALLVVLAGCGTSTAPAPNLGGGYFLAAIDGHPLPAASRSYPDGYTVEAAALGFGADRPRDGTNGVVTYAQHVRRPDQSLEITSQEYDYTVVAGVLHINLCPRFALCTAILTELVGPIGSDHELVLTQTAGGIAVSTFRFLEALPD